MVIIPIPQSTWWRVCRTRWEEPDKDLFTVITRADAGCRFWIWKVCRCNWGRVGPSNPHVDVRSPYLPGWNKTKSIQCTIQHDAPLKTLLGNQIFQSCWWAMHLFSALETKEPISCDLLFYSSEKFLGECSAGLFDVTELFSLTLCVEAMHNLSAGRILGCPFVFRLI